MLNTNLLGGIILLQGGGISSFLPMLIIIALVGGGMALATRAANKTKIISGGNTKRNLIRSETIHMNEEPRKCSDCGGEMVEGFTIDSRRLGRYLPQWYQGKPDLRDDSEGFYVDCPWQAPSCPILTFRCMRCGLLKFYGVGELTQT